MENSVRYRMHTLMQCADIDAFTAQKKAGSSIAYFMLLEEFKDAAPAMTAKLKAPNTSYELDAFLQHIGGLQRHLFAVGSSTLSWLAEKAISAATAGDQPQCAEAVFILSKRINNLCTLLEDAKIHPATAHAHKAAERDTPAPLSVPGPPPVAAVKGVNRPKAPLRPELLEKVGILIDNFEADDAMVMVRMLLAFSYTAAVDALLVSIYRALAKFDYDAAAGQTRQLLRIAQEATAKAGPAKKKILAIDDVPDVLNTIVSLLKKDYTVYGVTNHMAALKFLMNNTADLILLDIEMPDMNGFTLLSILRKIKAYATVPVLFVTGNVNQENVKKAHSLGGNDFIKKPIDPQILLEKLKKALPS